MSFGVLLLAALVRPAAARADDAGQSMFLRNEYDDNHCWQVSALQRKAPAMSGQTPAPPAGNKSPGLKFFGDGLDEAALNTEVQDPQLAVSPHYTLVLTAHSYVFYDRATANNQPLAKTGCVPVNGLFSDLFAPLLLPADLKGNPNDNDLNKTLGFGSDTKYPCDPQHYTDPKSGPPSGCIQGNYDARAYFDYDTSRFWIVAAARNHIWQCPSGSPCGDQARRYVFVAVSKDEDPRKGFWEYVLVREYADWPLFSVRNGRLLIAHTDKGGAGDKRLYVFDADKLVKGTTTDPSLHTYTEDQFPEADFITPVTQYSDAEGLSLVLGRKGKSLTVYAFKDPTKPMVKKTVTLSAAPGWAMQPVYRFGKFYFADDPCDDQNCTRHRINVHRVTAELSGSPVKVSKVSDENFALSDKNASLRMPGVLVEENRAAAVWYLSFPADGKPQKALYQVLYDGESGFRESALLRASDKARPEDFVGDEDIGGAAEPGQLGFWITHLYADSGGIKLQAVGKVNLTAKP